MSKNIVKTYLFKLDKLLRANGPEKLTVETLLNLDDPELYTLFHPGNPSYKDIRYEYPKAAYFNTHKLMLETKMARLEGKVMKFFDKPAKTDLLIIDDFELAHLEQQ